jgi:spermidine synthase
VHGWDQAESSRNLNASLRIGIVCGILFVSGIGALIFETLWLRLSGLAFGNSVWAVALILSSFMGGLALGNAIAATSRIRRWRPLHLYALLEVLVALLGCTIVFGLPALGGLLRPVWQLLWNYQPALLGLRFVVSFLILLVPTTAMGLTLPVLIEDPMLRQTNFGRAIGFLYGSNTLGAVVGAVLGEGYLIAAFGLRGTSLAAGLASCIAAAVALFVAKCEGDTSARLLQRTFPLRVDVRYRPPWRLLFVSFGTGCILLALEVIWFRFLRLYVASSPTAFAIMLAVVLAGIGLGSILGSARAFVPSLREHSRPRDREIDRSYNSARSGQQEVSGEGAENGTRGRCAPQSALPILLLLAAIATLLCYLCFPGELVPVPTGVFDLKWWQIGLLSIALMFPVAFLSGILFPFIASTVQASVKDRMNTTGVTTLFNTVGAALGPLIASFVLLPGIGYQWSLIFCAAGYALLSIPAAGPILLQKRTKEITASNADASSPFPSVKTSIILIGLWATLIVVLGIFPHRRAQAHFEHASHFYEVDDQGHSLARVVKKIEGSSDTWQLLRRDLFGQAFYYRLLVNAFSMSATDLRDQRYMRLFAYLPFAFRPEAQEVLLLCYGCGVTADALLRGPNVRRMDVVDISKEAFHLADFYKGTNYSNPLREPRAHPVVQDGRFFLQASLRRYDIITGEPPPPKVTGSVNLYTQEFFSLMKDRLKNGGIATFWLPIGQLKVEESKAILRAFRNAFSNALVWASADEEWIMMGINGAGHKVSEEEIRRLWSEPGSGEDLRRIGVEVPQQLGALFLMDGEEIDHITHDIAPLTDNYPKRLSSQLGDDKVNFRFASAYMDAPSAAARFVRSRTIAQIWPETLNTSIESFFAVRQTRFLSDTIGSNKLAELDLYLRGSRLRTPVLEVLGSDELRFAIADRLARNSVAPPIEILPDLIAGALARRDIGEAVHLLEHEKDHGMFTLNDAFLLTYLYCLSGSVEKAEAFAASNIGLIQNDWFVDWLWEKLKNDFGFHPPANHE